MRIIHKKRGLTIINSILRFTDSDEHRSDLLIQVDYPAYVIHITHKSEMEIPYGLAPYDERMQRLRKLSVRLKDISAGGLAFISSAELDMSDDYEFVLDRTKLPIVVRIKLLRAAAEPYGGFAYGCKFLDLFPDEEKLIREYVFKMQLRINKNLKIQYKT